LQSPDSLFNEIDRLGRKEVIEQLHKLYIISETASRKRILEILNKLEDVNHFELIENYFISEENPEVRIEAAQLLASNYKETEATQPLIWVLENEPTNEIKYIALKLLVELGYREEQLKKTVEILKRDLKSKSDNIKIEAAKSLGLLEVKSAVEDLIASLNTYNKRVRIQVIETLGVLKDEKAIHVLIPFLSTTSQDLWTTNFNALKNILAEKLPFLLIQILKETDDSVGHGFIRLGIIKALRKLKEKKAILSLIDLLEDHYYWVRWEAVKALDDLEPEWRKKYENILREKSTIIKE
jgi:HEAT repeat protein